MSEVRGVVVAHGSLAQILIETVEAISGVTGSLFPVTNAACSPEDLGQRIRATVGEGPAVVFVDLASGSCAHAALRLQRDFSSMAVVTGVNLPMLLDFVFHRDMDLAALTDRMVSKAHEGTTSFPPKSTA